MNLSNVLYELSFIYILNKILQNLISIQISLLILLTNYTHLYNLTQLIKTNIIKFKCLYLNLKFYNYIKNLKIVHCPYKKVLQKHSIKILSNYNSI